MERPERVLYGVLNVAVRLLLRSPLHGMLGGRVLLLTLTGRRSGRTFAVPVSYIRDGDSIVLFTSVRWSAWWRNLLGGARVKVRVRGRRLAGSARAERGTKAVAEGLQKFLTAFPGTARRYRVRLDAEGRPDRRDVDAAALDGTAVMVVLDPEAPGGAWEGS